VTDAAAIASALGAGCALVLFVLLAAAFALALRPVYIEHRRELALAAGALAAIALLKLAMLPLFPGYRIDLLQFIVWGTAMVLYGPAHVYDPQFVCRYTPAYLYALDAALRAARPLIAGPVARGQLAVLAEPLRIAVEIPPLGADFLVALLAFAWVRRDRSAKVAWAAALLFALNPALIYTTVVWGQNDSCLVLPVMLATIMAADRRYDLAGAMAAIAVLVKLQGLILLPVLGWWMLLAGSVPACALGALGFAAAAMITIAPFQIGHPWNWFASVIASSLDFFPKASVNAFNLMALVVGMHVPDSTTVLGVSAFTLGTALLGVYYAVPGWILWRERTARALLLSVFLAYLGFFVLGTRIHERYLYFAVALMAPLALESRAMAATFAILSATLLANQVMVKRFLEHEAFLAPRDPVACAIAVVNIAALIIVSVDGIYSVSDSRERWPRWLRPLFEPIARQPEVNRSATFRRRA
jgi:dolichyl-phosphate-mannose-protein mannosyltransferase